MEIENNTDMTRWIATTLEAMRAAQPPETSQKCPHCALVIRHPLIARQSDINDFSLLMKSAYEVMRRHGITAALLAEIRAGACIAIAKRQEQSK